MPIVIVTIKQQVEIDDQELGHAVRSRALEHFGIFDPDGDFYTDQDDHVYLDEDTLIMTDPVLAAMIDTANVLIHGHPLWKGQVVAAKATYAVR